jgi:uncharacterized DUF497 family protein
MQLEWDPEKRKETLKHRKLDFARCSEVFAGPTLTTTDPRDYEGETRMMTVGFLDAVLVVVVWTERDDHRRIISMRKATPRERKCYEQEMG